MVQQSSILAFYMQRVFGIFDNNSSRIIVGIVVVMVDLVLAVTVQLHLANYSTPVTLSCL